MHRKLIRPNLAELKEKYNQDKEKDREKDGSGKKKMHPPTDTFAENYYYLKQMNKRTPMAVVFIDGERVEGYIEWYDRNCIKLNRTDAPNLLIYKSRIKYIHKLGEPDKEVPEDEGPSRRA